MRSDETTAAVFFANIFYSAVGNGMLILIAEEMSNMEGCINLKIMLPIGH